MAAENGGPGPGCGNVFVLRLRLVELVNGSELGSKNEYNSDIDEERNVPSRNGPHVQLKLQSELGSNKYSRNILTEVKCNL